MQLTRIVAVLAVAMALGCSGDPIADISFQGTPLLTIEGRLASYDVRGDAELRVGVFWFLPGAGGGQTAASRRFQQEDVVEQPGPTVTVRFPEAFVVRIFESPPPAALVHGVRLLGVGQYALGTVLVYTDEDGDGRLDLGGDARELIGALSGETIVYAPAELNGAASPTGLSFAAGYHTLPNDDLVSCGFSSRRDPGTCDIPVGEPCILGGTRCAPGLCVSSAVGVEVFPKNYCLAPLESCTGNVSRAGVVFEGQTFVLQGCLLDRDCRVDDGYVCEEGGCVPAEETPCDALVGSPCVSDDDCGGAGLCLTTHSTIGALPGGMCSVHSSQTCRPIDAAFIITHPEAYAFARCLSDAECRAGYVCAADGLCVPEAAIRECRGRLGAACTSASDCGKETGCYTAHPLLGDLPGGYCVREEWGLDCSDEGVGDLNDVLILKRCASDDDCRVAEGYGCDAGTRACLPVERPGCRVPLGQACTSDSDCGEGRCLNRSGDAALPGGYCVGTIGFAGCVIGDGVSQNVGATALLFQGCRTDSECREGYACRGAPGRCLPDVPSQLVLRSPVEVAFPSCR